MKHVPIRVVAIAIAARSAAGWSRSRARRRVDQLADRKQRASPRPRCRPGQSEGRPTASPSVGGKYAPDPPSSRQGARPPRQALTPSARPRSDLLQRVSVGARRQRAGQHQGEPGLLVAAAGRGIDRDRSGRREPDPRRPERLPDRLQSLRHRLERGRRAPVGRLHAALLPVHAAGRPVRRTPASTRRSPGTRRGTHTPSGFSSRRRSSRQRPPSSLRSPTPGSAARSSIRPILRAVTRNTAPCRSGWSLSLNDPNYAVDKPFITADTSPSSPPSTATST